MATVKFKNVNKIYDNKVQAVFDFNLEVKDKEFVVLVGPSGCGKSTTLRMLAGLEEISSGEIIIDDVVVNQISSKDRDIAMVFQSYALYPHMTVYDNMAFALKLRQIPVQVYDDEGKPIYVVDEELIKEHRMEIHSLQKQLKKTPVEEKEDLLNKIKEHEDEIVKITEACDLPLVKWVHYPKEEIDARVKEASKILGLDQYLKRKPRALSGGQRQRVALGRAIVRTPKVFLMDEPLSNLDAKLRVQMRSEIAKIHQKVGATTIYVTHDQTEAMTMADRIVIMKDGYIQQIGAPKEIYDKPNNIFVGGFLGSPAMNFITGTIKNGEFIIDENNRDFVVKLNSSQLELLNDYENKEIILGIRPEDIYLNEDIGVFKASKEFKLEADVSELLGHELIVYGFINGQRLIVKTKAKFNINVGDTNLYYIDENKTHFFDPETTNRIG